MKRDQTKEKPTVTVPQRSNDEIVVDFESDERDMFEVARSVGQSFPRTDALMKTMGLAEYTDDLHFRDLAYGMILRSPHSKADVRLVDDREARAVPGFLGLLTPDDVPDRLYNCSGNPPSALIIPDERILTWHPKCLGDRILAVVAETPEACEAALRALHVEYDVQEPVMDVRKALAEDAPQVQPERSENNLMYHMHLAEGDVEKGFAEADHIFEETFYTQPIHQLYLEPTSCVCHYRQDGKITVWSPSQTLFQERRILAELFDRSESDIRIIKPAMGGGFGARQQLHNQHIGVLLSKMIYRPVKILNRREEDITASSTRHATTCTIKIGVMDDGSIKAVSIRNLLNGGPYITHTPTVGAAAGKKFQYHTEHYSYDGISVYTNSLTAGAMRGYGNIQVVFGREILLDRIARALNLDPVETRLKYHLQVGDHFPAADYDILSCGIEDCVKKAERIRATIDAERPPRDDDEVREAWGIAFCCHSSGPSNRDGMSSAVVMANDDGSVVLSIGSADIGQGSETVMAQIAAETLGIPFENVEVRAADTAATPYDTGTFASGQTFVCGNAVTIACRRMRDNLRDGLARFYDTDASEITDDGQRFAVHTEEGIIFLDFIEAVGKIAFGMKGMVVIGQGSYKALGSPPPFAVCYARARYDKRTDQVAITDIIEVVDVGQPINPEQVKAQVHGGVATGFGYAMIEDIEYNRRAKKTQSVNLLHYKAPLMNDVPRIYADIAEGVKDPAGPFGAKSVGELSAVPVAPAVANAVARASETEIAAMPICRVLPPAAYTADRRDIRFDDTSLQGGAR